MHVQERKGDSDVDMDAKVGDESTNEAIGKWRVPRRNLIYNSLVDVLRGDYFVQTLVLNTR